ncbi:MAG: putative TIM-barrel fold metal-dependent hydrolase [Acidimicrobiales bacterium]|nr:putative TIM-barrel fold metal-dependent hydrolase [Acidimicrobiales bacterium]
MQDFPKIISVDDHVIEHATVWQDRLPEKYQDVGPHVVQERGIMQFVGGNFSYRPDPEGDRCDWWLFEDKRVPQTRLSAAAGFDRDEVKVTGITYEEMRRGCWDPVARLEDMDVNHTEASLAFPSFPRFCGQTFMEATDKDLADLCVKAYNDWMVDEWCAGSGGRLIPLIIIQLWDVQLAAQEIYRNAERGVHAVCFSEIPPYLGLPSIHSDYWDPFFRACEETKTTINMHIGSSSKMPSTSADAPAAVGSTLTFGNAMSSLTDWLFSGNLVKFPELTIAYSEGQIGWIPYILERADKVWEDNRAWGGVAGIVTEPPSTYYYRQVYGCFFDDVHGLASLDVVGEDNITFETDYPHSDSTWPHTLETAKKLMGHLPTETIYKLVRGNAIKMLHLDFDR